MSGAPSALTVEALLALLADRDAPEGLFDPPARPPPGEGSGPAGAVTWPEGTGAGRDAAPGDAREPGPWAETARALELLGIQGLAVARWGERLPDGVRARLEPAYRRTALWTELALEAGTRAREALAAAGVESTEYKGAALVRTGVYADPGARGMDDVDLLVPEPDADRAVRVLAGAGFRPWTPWAPARVGWLDSASFYVPESPPGLPVSVDLHWRTGYGRLRFGGGEARLLGAGPGHRTPAAEPHLALIAEHLLKHLRVTLHVRALGDLARLATRVESWEEVERAIAASPLEAGIRALLDGVGRELGAPVPDALGQGVPEGTLRRLRPRRLLEDALGDALAGRAPRSREPGLAGWARYRLKRLDGVLLRWRLLGSPGAVVDDLARTVVPPGSWLEARYGKEGYPLPGGRRVRYLKELLWWGLGWGVSPVSPNQELESAR